MSTPRIALAALLLLVGLPAVPLAAQTPATQPAAPPTADAPVTQPGADNSLPVRVLAVRGDVMYVLPDSTEWKPAAQGDTYPERVQLRTGVRSSVKLQIGDEEPFTAMVVESMANVIISEALKTPDTKKVRVGLGYGKMRAGVAEGGLKSDFTVDSPVATLSKKGTWNFGMSVYEDRFEVFLLDYGLVDAFKKASGEVRQLTPGEHTTSVMRKWLDEAQRGRTIPFVDLLGQGDVDIAFNRLRTDGLRVLNPEGGQSVLIDLSNASAQQTFADLLRNSLPVQPVNVGGGQIGPRVRAEAFFGTGRGDQLVPVIIDANSPLSQKGFARPGQYMFRRGAAESFLKSAGR